MSTKISELPSLSGAIPSSNDSPISVSGTTYRFTVGDLAAVSSAGNSSLSTPLIKLSGTWISGGTSTTTKPHILVEVAGATSTSWSTSGTALGINSSSGFIGNLLDLKKDGTTAMSVNYQGQISLHANGSVGNVNGTTALLEFYNGLRFGNQSGMGISWSNNASPNTSVDIGLYRDGVGALAQRSGTTSQCYSLYGTYTSSTSYERTSLKYSSGAGAFQFLTEKGSGGGTARNLELGVNGSAILKITTDNTQVTNKFSAGSFYLQNSTNGWLCSMSTTNNANNVVGGFLNSGNFAIAGQSKFGWTANIWGASQSSAQMTTSFYSTGNGTITAYYDTGATFGFVEDRYRSKGITPPEGLISGNSSQIHHVEVADNMTPNLFKKNVGSDGIGTPNINWEVLGHGFDDYRYIISEDTYFVIKNEHRGKIIEISDGPSEVFIGLSQDADGVDVRGVTCEFITHPSFSGIVYFLGVGSVPLTIRSKDSVNSLSGSNSYAKMMQLTSSMCYITGDLTTNALPTLYYVLNPDYNYGSITLTDWTLRSLNTDMAIPVADLPTTSANILIKANKTNTSADTGAYTFNSLTFKLPDSVDYEDILVALNTSYTDYIFASNNTIQIPSSNLGNLVITGDGLELSVSTALGISSNCTNFNISCVVTGSGVAEITAGDITGTLMAGTLNISSGVQVTGTYFANDVNFANLADYIYSKDNSATFTTSVINTEGRLSYIATINGTDAYELLFRSSDSAYIAYLPGSPWTPQYVLIKNDPYWDLYTFGDYGVNPPMETITDSATYPIDITTAWSFGTLVITNR
jgi:hypothetical protein